MSLKKSGRTFGFPWCVGRYVCFRISSRYFPFFLYLTLKNEIMQNAILISLFFKGGGHKFTKFACVSFF